MHKLGLDYMHIQVLGWLKEHEEVGPCFSYNYLLSSVFCALEHQLFQKAPLVDSMDIGVGLVAKLCRLPKATNKEKK